MAKKEDTREGSVGKKKELQSLLKQAKAELHNEDYDECVSLCKSILKLDKDNFYALLFMGKSLQFKKRKDEALKCYVKACELNPDQALCWKGQLSVRVEDADYSAFFECILQYTKLLISKNDPLTEAVSYVDEYVKNHGPASIPLKTYYLRQIIPGLSELGDLLGYQVASPSKSLGTLIDIVESEETAEIKKIKERTKLTFSISLTERAKNDRYNEKIWPLVSVSEIPQLYELLINLEQDDHERYKIQDKYLRYKYNLLLVAPTAPAEVKASLRADILDIVDGLVLIKCPSEFAWNLYFDWYDPASLGDLQLDNIATYLSLFGTEKGYGSIFYQFLISDICPFDKNKIIDYLEPAKRKKGERRRAKKTNAGSVTEQKQESNAETEEEEAKDKTDPQEEKDKRFEIFDVNPQNILTSMNAKFSQVKNSVICCRIVLDYYVHMKEYVLALDASKQFTKTIVDLKNKIGSNFVHSKFSHTLNLATIYTYYEAPKNFSKALSLYNSLSEKDPENLTIKIGKALILVETKKFEDASQIFLDLIKNNPHNVDAIQEYGWCQLHLNNYDLGRKYLENALSILQDEDNKSYKPSNIIDISSKLLYRLAISYFMEFNNSETVMDSETLQNSVNKCTSLLLKCLKISPNYAPAFTTLGSIYYDYADNKDRAIRCFYKAFELDPAEIEASYKLAEHFASISDWQMTDIICRAVIENDRAKRNLNSPIAKLNDNSWPYRILGCVSMEFKNDTKAIEYFQTALRMNPFDIASWLGLGEAYISRGRIDASIRVFSHVIRLQSGIEDNECEITVEMEMKADWHAIYLLASSYSSMLEFDKSIRLLNNLLKYDKKQKENPCILILLIETMILRCGTEITRGAILRASDTLLETFDLLFSAFKLEAKSMKLWKSLSELIVIALKIQLSIPRIRFSKIGEIVKDLQLEKNDLWDDLNLSGYDIDHMIANKEYVLLCHLFYTLSCIGGFLCCKSDDIRILRSSLIFNLALSLLSWYKYSNIAVFRDLSIKALNKAILLEPDNAEYWNCLAIVLSRKNAKVSQHCFIKALALDNKSPIYWFNLGMLYVDNSDFELANESFIRAQSLFASSPDPWVGQAIVSRETDDKVSAKNLFTHSYSLSKGSNPSNTLLYAISVLDAVMGGSEDERDLETVQQLTSVNYGMMNYLKFYPNDTFALELSIDISERLYSFTGGIQHSEKLCLLLEQEYEKFETEEILINFCRAKCQLSRLLLAKKEYSRANEICEEIGALLGTIDTFTADVQKCMLSCFTVLGLVLYFQNEFDQSLVEFKKLLEVFPENKKIVVLISQVLYASGESEAKQAAMDELLNNIEEHGVSLIVSMTIAAISLVEGWEDYSVAVKEFLEQLSLESLIADSHREIPKLLTMISNKINAKGERAERLWERNAVLFPGDTAIWGNLDNEVTLDLCANSSKESAMSVSAAYVKTNRLREVQRGILLSGGVSEEGLSLLCSLAN